LEKLKSFSNLFGAGLDNFFGDRQKVELVVGGAAVLGGSIIFFRQGFGLMFRQLEARMMKPSVIQETSRISLNDAFNHPIRSLNIIKSKFKKSEDALQGVVLKPEIEETIRNLAIKTKQCRLVGGKYNNVLLHGPPGTGKTLFARKLAYNSDMDYAMMSGGDLQVVGRKGVDSIHKLFAWAKTSRRGLILFIDEAETFLVTRHSGVDQSLRESLAAFLSNTGEQNEKFMMVLTSNIPHELDTAVLSRVKHKVEFALPGLHERTRLVAQFFQEYILDPVATGKWRMKLDECNWTTTCKNVAELTEGMSGRELAQLASDWQMETVASESGVLTSELMLQATQRAMENKKLEQEWGKQKEEASYDYMKLMKQSTESIMNQQPNATPV